MLAVPFLLCIGNKGALLKSDFSQSQFGRWRTILWPIHHYELKKLIPMLLIFFFISFSYNMLRTLKDTLVVTASNSGAEVIPFIKVWVMFPSSILLTYMFTRLANRFSKETVFYMMVAVFLGFFLFFLLALYPNRESLHPVELADRLQLYLPLGLKGFVSMFRNWTFTTFYVMSELWSNIILSMLFWGFANQVTRLHEAARFYGLFGVGANCSGIAAGWVSIWVCNNVHFSYNFYGKEPWDQTFFVLVSLVILSGFIALAIFYYLSKCVLKDPKYYEQDELVPESKKRKISMRESIRALLGSNYLFYIAVIMICYNLVIVFVEVLWKHEVKMLYPNPQEYTLYMNTVTMVIGMIATFVSLFVSGNSIRKLGWSVTAMMTPVVLFVTSLFFFGTFFLSQWNYLAVESFGMAPLALVVFFGTSQNVLSRAAKYTVFDATREMAFVPLSSQEKTKGKAVIDGLCSRLGKSGGSLIYQTLFVSFSTITACAPYIAFILFSTIGVWGVSTYLLGLQFRAVTQRGVKPEASLALQEPSHVSL